jgi:membrane-bound hydrogenase subunit mbhJ
MLKGLKKAALTRSLWVYHIAASPCNNCDIEILDLLTPRFDVERFGLLLAPSPRHADLLLVTGMVNKKVLDRVLRVYAQTPKPCVVAAVGSCAISGDLFVDSYNFAGPLDKHIPVDVYIGGCPPKPEAMILGVVRAIEKLKKLKDL